MAVNLSAAWIDSRDANPQVYAGSLSDAGDYAWTENGAAVSLNTVSLTAPLWVDVCPDGAGGMFVAFWQNVPAGSSQSVYLQRLTTEGEVYSGWPAGGLNLLSTPYGLTPGIVRVIADSQGGAIVAWNDPRNGTSAYAVFAQKVSGAGVAQWTADGVNLKTPSAYTGQNWISVSGDGTGGAFIAWSTTSLSCFAQYIDADGNIQFGTTGVSLGVGGGTSTASRGVHILAAGSSDGCFVLVNHTTTFVKRLTDTGATYSGWAAGGTTIGTLGRSGSDGGLVLDGTGGAIAFFYQLSGTTHNIMAQRLDSTGVIQWASGGVTVGPSITGTAANRFGDFHVIRDTGTGAVIAWRHGLAGAVSCDIYCAKVLSTGTVSWATLVCAAANNQSLPCVMSSEDGYFLIWADFRNGATADIYAQRLDESGGAQWTTDGLSMAVAVGSQTRPIGIATIAPVIVVIPDPAEPNSRAGMESNIRLLIDDNDKDSYSISGPTMIQLMNTALHMLANRVMMEDEALLTVQLVAGTYDYTLTGIAGPVRNVFLSPYGLELERMEWDEITVLYRQDTAAPAGSGVPSEYALVETSAQASKIRVAPTPSSLGAVAMKVRYSIIPAALTAETSTVPFSQSMLRAFERQVASMCVALMSPEDRKRRMLGVEQVKGWQEMVESTVREENWRMRLGSTQDAIMEYTDQWR